ncbi:MAG: RHS repeat domain-containing protein [Nitrospirota bacterium]
MTDIRYDAFSKRTRLVLGNGTQTDYTYDADTFRLQQLRTLGPGGVLQHLNYTYDAVGNVQTIRDGLSAGYSESFDYDDLHRLTGAFGAYGSLTYAYDPIGNMTCNSQISPCSATSPNYAYPPSGATSVRPHAVNQAGPYTYTYDANGNMTSGAGRSLTYDVDNRPTSMTVGSSTVTFAYDYSGERVRKQVAGGAMTTYVGAIYECAASCTKYLFAGSTRVAQKTSDGTVVYFHGNHLGSTHIVTNAAGAAVEEIHYYPYGGTFSDTNGEAGGVNRRYTGQEMDSETGLYYYHARYYDPVLGRFISADIAGVTLSVPQSLNRYSYVLNNPLRFTDPTGFQVCNGDAAGNTICMGTNGPIIFPKDPMASAIMGTSDGTFNVGRANANRDFQQALEREANPTTRNQWLPSWQQPATTGGGGGCGGLSAIACFGRGPNSAAAQQTIDTGIALVGDTRWSKGQGSDIFGVLSEANRTGRLLDGPVEPPRRAQWDPGSRTITFDLSQFESNPGGVFHYLPGVMVHEGTHLYLGHGFGDTFSEERPAFNNQFYFESEYLQRFGEKARYRTDTEIRRQYNIPGLP